MSNVPLSTGCRRRVEAVRFVTSTVFSMLVRRRVEGLENVPPDGACLIVFNHLSNFDPHLIFSLLRRADTTGLVAENYRRNPLTRFAIEAAGGMWIRRGAGDRAALEAALSRLSQGWIVGIAPEGRRSPSGALAAARRGPAFLATRANVPILPVAVTNTENLARALRSLRRVTLTVRFGEPFMLPPPTVGSSRKQQLQEATDVLMCRIAALLPSEYRGVYAGHPRLEALYGGTAGPRACSSSALSRPLSEGENHAAA
jgi:1-acyl-sn-glycerol-3-phosphate acyltransferase